MFEKEYINNVLSSLDGSQILKKIFSWVFLQQKKDISTVIFQYSLAFSFIVHKSGFYKNLQFIIETNLQ